MLTTSLANNQPSLPERPRSSNARLRHTTKAERINCCPTGTGPLPRAINPRAAARRRRQRHLHPSPPRYTRQSINTQRPNIRRTLPAASLRTVPLPRPTLRLSHTTPATTHTNSYLHRYTYRMPGTPLPCSFPHIPLFLVSAKAAVRHYRTVAARPLSHACPCAANGVRRAAAPCGPRSPAPPSALRCGRPPGCPPTAGR